MAAANVTQLRPAAQTAHTARPAQTARPDLSAVSGPAAYTPAERTAAVSAAPELRGFALYVGVDDADQATLTELVTALREVLAERAPRARSYASVAFAPTGTPGESIDLVRLALQEPRAVAESRAERQQAEREEEARRSAAKVIIDTSRKRVTVHGDNADLTYKEFELLQVLVLREGRTVGRDEIIDVLWADSTEERPHERTIDVHVRRLRKKLGEYADIVRTVRGGGYRFDRHADARVVHAPAPSPDRL